MEALQSLKAILKAKGHSNGIGDEGGFSPNQHVNQQDVEVILEAIEKARYQPGCDISIALDPATSEMGRDGTYVFFKSYAGSKTTDEMIALWKSWLDRYPIVLLEDTLREKDWGGWEALTRQLGSRVEIVGDDLLCTSLAHARLYQSGDGKR